MSEPRDRPQPIDPYRRSLHSSSRNRRKTLRRRRLVLLGAAVVIIALIVVGYLFLFNGNAPSSSGGNNPNSSSTSSSNSGSTSSSGGKPGSTTTLTAGITMKVAPIASTTPSSFKLSTGVYKGTTKITNYTRTDPIDLGPGKDYTSLMGIITFRGTTTVKVRVTAPPTSSWASSKCFGRPLPEAPRRGPAPVRGRAAVGPGSRSS